MAWRAPFIRRSGSADATRTAAASPDRPVRPEIERTAPLRAPVRPSTLDEAAIVKAPSVEPFLGVAYQVFDAYLEEGRKFAEGRSAWYDAATADQVASRVSGAPADVSEVFAKLARDLVGAMDPGASRAAAPTYRATTSAPLVPPVTPAPPALHASPAGPTWTRQPLPLVLPYDAGDEAASSSINAPDGKGANVLPGDTANPP